MFEEFKNAFQRYNNAHVQLILINVAIFLGLIIIKVPLVMSGFEGIFNTVHDFIAIPASVSEFITRPWTIITYAFVHDLSGIFHILFNMLVLYWFGRVFIEYLGSDKLIAVYVLGALAGGVFYLLAYNTIPFFVTQSAQHHITMVGASAAVDAIVVATAVL